MPKHLIRCCNPCRQNGSNGNPVLKNIVAMLFCLLLVSCAGIVPDKMAQEEASPLSCTGDLDLSGRFSMYFMREGNEEAVHGSFLWNQINDRTGIQLLSPLGQTIATIDVTPGSAILKQAGRQPRSEANADALAAAELGWPLPISGMKSWLRGCAVDANGLPYIASQRTNSVTTRDGWRISYVSWQKNASEKLHPKRIDLERLASPAGDISIRLIIDSWQTP